MTGMPVPPGGIPPGVGLAPPPSVSMPYSPHLEAPSEAEEENLVRQRDWAFQDAEADQYKSTSDLKRDAERTRERVNDSVQELRARLGLDPDAAHAHGPFAPVRRHPFTVAIAATGAAAAVVGVRVFRDHRKASKAARDAAREAVKATERRRRAARKASRKRWAAAKDVFGSAATAVRRQRKKTMKRLTHR
ncbi:hypothetical protein [Glycomyces sp. YM15]|uniref:hypothetical protein n=1 Tax=Glycomyces sp. YM15 TaxID=2800446 RepID=UPI00196699DE|nr:hypothetical protein [Glycomyces sp. YM15]